MGDQAGRYLASRTALVAQADRLHWDEGLTVRQVAVRLQVPTTTAYRLLDMCPRGRRAGTPTTQPQPHARADITPELVAGMYWVQHLTMPQIAAALGCSPSTVHNRLHRASQGVGRGRLRPAPAVPLAPSTQDTREGDQ
jgi:DNA-binding transcriptional regulator LsrR (DeoR family)